MGVTFRSGGYIKHVTFGGRTIKDGEAAAIWDSNGVHKEIIGPKRIWLINSTIRFLTRHKAESHQFLKISHCDGRIENIKGPLVLYENPAYHDSVCVQDGFRLCSSSECIVSFNRANRKKNSDSKTDYQNSSNSSKALNRSKQDVKNTHVYTAIASNPSHTQNIDEDKALTKINIIYGPTLYIPDPNEYTCKFSWSSFASMKKIVKSFEILRTSMTSCHKIIKIATVDGFSFDVSLLLNLKITSIEKILASPDPIDDMHNAILSDSQTLGRDFSSEILKTKKEDVVSILSNINTYPSLMNVAERYGFEIHSIQLTTFALCPALCEQIESEQGFLANLRAEVAKQKHTCQIRDMELEDQRKRLEDESAFKKEQITMNEEFDSESHKYKLSALERRAKLEKLNAEANNDVMKVKEGLILEFLIKLKDMGVDMTKFMTTYGGISAASKVVGKSDVLKMNDKVLKQD